MFSFRPHVHRARQIERGTLEGVVHGIMLGIGADEHIGRKLNIRRLRRLNGELDGVIARFGRRILAFRSLHALPLEIEILLRAAGRSRNGVEEALLHAQFQLLIHLCNYKFSTVWKTLVDK